VDRTRKEDVTQKIYLLIVVKMSKHMLSDQASIDKINPYVAREFSLPGSSRRPNSFAPHKKTEEEGMPENEHIICEYGVTAGDKTVDFCKGKSACELSRPLIPGRNIDLGYDEPKPSVIRESAKFVKSIKKLDAFTIIIVVLIILLLSTLKRR
jgi:hypothetical protein